MKTAGCMEVLTSARNVAKRYLRAGVVRAGEEEYMVSALRKTTVL